MFTAPQVLGVHAAMLLDNTNDIKNTLNAVSTRDLRNAGVSGFSFGSKPISLAHALPKKGVYQTKLRKNPTTVATKIATKLLIRPFEVIGVRCALPVNRARTP